MVEKFSRWDAADDLKTTEDIAMYFDACVDEDPGDGSLVQRALGDIARARGQISIADVTPEIVTLMKAIKPLGLKLHVA